MPRNLSIDVSGIHFDNPFLLASGPPGASGRVIAKSFELGWGGAVTKTVSLESSRIVHTRPRYAKIYTREGDQLVGFENIELISERPLPVWLEELRDLKRSFPDKVLIASIMEEYDERRWRELVERVQATGVDGLELNLSCPHGLPERRMGSFMGSDPQIVTEVVGWVKRWARVPVWAKLTPNVGDIREPARAAIRAGADGLSAINTVLCVAGVNLETLRPTPTVEGYSVPGGYSGPAIRPIALRCVMEIARALHGAPISGIGGIETGADAAQFLLLGASTVQLCTGAMLRGYGIIDELTEDLQRFMAQHGFESVREFVGRSLPYFTTHGDLVAMQERARREALERRSPEGRAARAEAGGWDPEERDFELTSDGPYGE